MMVAMRRALALVTFEGDTRLIDYCNTTDQLEGKAMTPSVILFILVQLGLLPLMTRSMGMIGFVAWLMTTAFFGVAMFAPTWIIS